MNSYAYDASMWCYKCAQNIIADLDRVGNEDTGDTNDYPQPVFNSESDCPQHCDGCGCFLYNDLTGDGNNYVRDIVNDDLRDGKMDSVAVTEWMDYYDYIDYVKQCDRCGCYDSLSDYLCDSCNESEGEYIYDDVEECMTSGEHLSDCDDDGCCNLCGYDDPIDL